jgi:hypothetical protein
MAFTVDGKALSVDEWSEEDSATGGSFFEWGAGAIRSMYNQFSYERVWSLQCHESEVLWADSVAKYLQDQLMAKTAVNLVITVQASVNVTAQILKVSVKHTSPDARLFTIQLQEVPT